MDTVVAIASSESQATFQRMDFSASAVASIASLTLSEVRGKDEQVEVQGGGVNGALSSQTQGMTQGGIGTDGARSNSDTGPGAYSNSDTSSMNDGSVEASLLETFLANNALSAGCDMRMDGLPKPQICFDFTKGVCTRGDKCKYSHDLATIVSFNSKEKGICFDYLRNQCTRGLLCRFSHDLSNIAQQVYNGAAMQTAANPGNALKMQPPVAGKPSAICYDFVKGVCQRASECRYSHDLSLIARMARGGPAAATPKTAEICYDYLRGRCNRGAMCKYSHNISFLAAPGMLATSASALGGAGLEGMQCAQGMGPRTQASGQQPSGTHPTADGMAAIPGMQNGLASSLSADQVTTQAFANASAIERSRSMNHADGNDTSAIIDQPQGWGAMPPGCTHQHGYGGMPNGPTMQAAHAANGKLMAMQQALYAAAVQQHVVNSAASQQQQHGLAMAAAAGFAGLPRMGMQNMGGLPEQRTGPQAFMAGAGMPPGNSGFNPHAQRPHGMPDGRSYQNMPMMGGMGPPPQNIAHNMATDRIAQLLGVRDRHMLADTLGNLAAVAKAQATVQGPAGMQFQMHMGHMSPMQQQQQGMSHMQAPPHHYQQHQQQQAYGAHMMHSLPQPMPGRSEAHNHADMGAYSAGSDAALQHESLAKHASSVHSGSLQQHEMLPLIKDIWSKPSAGN